MSKIFVTLLASLLLLNSCSSKTLTLVEEPPLSYPLYLTTMTHMEGNFDDAESEIVFDKHVDMLRYAMDLAEEYEAILTIETEKPFAEANAIWGLNIMEEILERGHGVGTHCDVGGPTGDKKSPEEFAKEIRENKELVDVLVGAENNHGCSGAGGFSDWAQAMTIAGFDYINGIVGMHLLAVPEAERPMPWDDKVILNSGAFHYSFPEEVIDRIYLFQLEDTTDWQADETGIVVSSGELGRLDGLAEGGFENSSTCPANRNCPLTMEDVDAFVEIVEAVANERDASKVAKLTLYFPVSNFMPENEEVLRAFFETAQELQAEGKIEWASQWEVVETYLTSLN